MSSIVSQAVTTDKSVAPEHAPKGNFAGSIELPLNRTLPRTTTTPPHNTQHSVAMAAEQQPAHKPKVSEILTFYPLGVYIFTPDIIPS
jgi:hypothetical protein